MLDWQNISAWVAVDGKEIAHYGVEISQDDKIVTCWIPSELGKNFSVCWVNRSLPQDLTGQLTIDGKGCGGVVAQHHKDIGRTLKKFGITDGRIFKPFVFAALHLSENEAPNRLGHFLSDVEQLGVIELTIRPIKIIGRGPSIGGTLPTFPNAKVDENSKKIISQYTLLGPDQVFEQPRKFVKTKLAGPDIVTFQFKYRSIEILRANGIVPSSSESLQSGNPDIGVEIYELQSDAEEDQIMSGKIATADTQLVVPLEQNFGKHDNKIVCINVDSSVLEQGVVTQQASKDKIDVNFAQQLSVETVALALGAKVNNDKMVCIKDEQEKGQEIKNEIVASATKGIEEKSKLHPKCQQEQDLGVTQTVIPKLETNVVVKEEDKAEIDDFNRPRKRVKLEEATHAFILGEVVDLT